MAIRVVVVDDHQLLLDSLVRVLEAEDDIEVVDTATSVHAGVDATQRHHPDVIVLDKGLTSVDGMDPEACIRDAWPDGAILVLTAPNTDDDEPDSGARHVLDKTHAIDELAASIRAAAAP